RRSVKHPVTRRAALAVVAVVMVLSLAAGRAQPAAAAPGDLVADVLVPEAESVWARGLAPSVAFDGRYLYYLDYAGSVLHRIDVPPAGSATTGTGHVDAPVIGAPSGIMTIAYDAGRDLFWAIGGDGLSAYAINFAGPQSTQDVECDDLSYGVAVFWIKDGYDGHIRAFEQPRSGACLYGGGPAGAGLPPLGLP